MTLDRLNELRLIAMQNKGHRSAEYMLELIAELDRVQELYCLALDYGWSHHRARNVAFSKLKELATK